MLQRIKIHQNLYTLVFSNGKKKPIFALKIKAVTDRWKGDPG